MAATGRSRRDLALGDRAAIALAAVLVGLVALGSDDPPPSGDARDPDALAALILVAALGLLVLRKRAPATVTAAVMGLAFAWYATGYVSGLINVPTMVAFYTLGTTGDRRRQIGVGAGSIALLVFGSLLMGDEGVGGVVDAIGWTVAAILAGELVRSRRLLLDELEERARRAEAERDAEAERRVGEERLRIARDLHDVLAHTVSVMTVQAGVAADNLERNPPAAADALGAIRTAGREAMAEVTALVSVLRDGADPVGTEPAPGLGRLDDLVAAARASGIDVSLSSDLAPTELPRVLELAIFRIVQEGLTNVLRHARASRAWIEVRRDPHEIVVEIRDDGSAAAPATSPDSDGHGFGLRGMGERVEALGGRLAYGPAPGGGWLVTATLPA